MGWRGSPHLPESHGICGCRTSPLQCSGSSLFPPAAPGSFPDGLELSGHASELLYLLSAPAKISIPAPWKNIRQPDIKEWCEEAELCQGSRKSWHLGFFHLAFFPLLPMHVIQDNAQDPWKSPDFSWNYFHRLLVRGLGQLGIDPGAFQGNISGFRCLSRLVHLIQAPRTGVGWEGMWHSQDGDKVGSGTGWTQ